MDIQYTAQLIQPFALAKKRWLAFGSGTVIGIRWTIQGIFKIKQTKS